LSVLTRSPPQAVTTWATSFYKIDIGNYQQITANFAKNFVISLCGVAYRRTHWKKRGKIFTDITTLEVSISFKKKTLHK